MALYQKSANQDMVNLLISNKKILFINKNIFESFFQKTFKAGEVLFFGKTSYTQKKSVGYKTQIYVKRVNPI